MDDTIVRLLRAESSIAGSFFLISMMLPVYATIGVLPWLTRLADPRLMRSILASVRPNATADS